MSDSIEHQSTWVYEGIWGVLSSIFCVPRDAPALPTLDAEKILSRKPAPNYLKYLKFQFRLGLAVVAVPLIVGSIILAFTENEWFLLASVALVLLIGTLSLIAILAIHLRYDTMWYVFSDRSMRLRRGIWVIRESTITFENIQNVKVIQGPLQRWFGIADVVVETAGGGGANAEPGGLGMHSGVIEGVADATTIRDSIMDRVRSANTTGLGDESPKSPKMHGAWSASHLAMLREIRDLARESAAE
jgi:membrane protein YdbS with pleckstrin-like domain